VPKEWTRGRGSVWEPHHVEEAGHDGVADHVLGAEKDVVVAVVDVLAAHRAEVHEVLGVAPVHLRHDPAQTPAVRKAGMVMPLAGPRWNLMYALLDLPTASTTSLCTRQAQSCSA